MESALDTDRTLKRKGNLLLYFREISVLIRA